MRTPRQSPRGSRSTAVASGARVAGTAAGGAGRAASREGRDWKEYAALAVVVVPLIGVALAAATRPAYVAYYHGLGLSLDDVDGSSTPAAGYTLSLFALYSTFIGFLVLIAIAVMRLADVTFAPRLKRRLTRFNGRTTDHSGRTVWNATTIRLTVSFALVAYSPLILALLLVLLFPATLLRLLVSMLFLGVGVGGLLVALREASAAQSGHLRQLLVSVAPVVVVLIAIATVWTLWSSGGAAARAVRQGDTSAQDGFLEVQSTRVMLMTKGGDDPLSLCPYDALGTLVASSETTAYVVIRGREHAGDRSYLAPVVPVPRDAYAVIDVDSRRAAASHSVCARSLSAT